MLFLVEPVLLCIPLVAHLYIRIVARVEEAHSALQWGNRIPASRFANRSSWHCVPYAEVIDIDPARLPSPALVRGFTPEAYTSALRHNQSNPQYNPHFRQLLHVGFKAAAKMGARYLEVLGRSKATVSRNVTENLFKRHIKPLLLENC